jgi:hypothetical protein
MHETAIANRSEQERECEVEAENPCPQRAFGKCDGVPGAEGYIFVNAAILAESDLAFGSPIEIVENGTWHAALRDGTEICDAHNFGRGD